MQYDCYTLGYNGEVASEPRPSGHSGWRLEEGFEGRSEHFPTYFQVSENTMWQAAGWAVFALDPSSETGPPWTQWHTRDYREHSPATQVCESSQQKQLTAVTGKTESQCWRTHNQVKASTPLPPLQKTLHYTSPSKQFPVKGERHVDRNQRSKWKAICGALAWHAGVPRPCTGEKSGNCGGLAVSERSEQVHRAPFLILLPLLGFCFPLLFLLPLSRWMLSLSSGPRFEPLFIVGRGYTCADSARALCQGGKTSDCVYLQSIL